MTFRREWLTEFRPINGETVSFGDDGECGVTGIGKVKIQRLVNGIWRDGVLEDVLLVLHVKKNLVSVGACAIKGFCIRFEKETVEFMREGVIEATGVKQSNKLYRMFFRVLDVKNEANVSALDLKIWHERLGHIHKRALCDLVEKELVHGVKVNNILKFFCDVCQMGKIHKLLFKSITERVERQPGEFVHSDVCGPMSVQSLASARFFVIFMNDATGFRHVYFVRYKLDVFDKFQEYEQLVLNKFGRAMKTLRADNGLEYCNEKMRKYLTEKGIVMENTAPYNPQQNGRAERDNRTIVECARTMLQAKKLPKFLWAEAVNTAIYTLNRTGHSRLDGGKTPYELWTGKKPDLSHIRIFGSEAFVHVPKMFTKKFDARAKRTLLVGYQGESSNYRLYNPDTKTVSVSRDVSINEQAAGIQLEEYSEADLPLPSKRQEDPTDEAVKDSTDNAENQTVDNDTDSNEPTINNDMAAERAQVNPGTRSLRDRTKIKPPSRYDLNFAKYNAPTSFQDAISGTEGQNWKQAIQEELEAHRKNETWSIVPRVPGGRTIDSKWV